MKRKDIDWVMVVGRVVLWTLFLVGMTIVMKGLLK
jgi:hypothetical protein